LLARYLRPHKIGGNEVLDTKVFNKTYTQVRDLIFPQLSNHIQLLHPGEKTSGCRPSVQAPSLVCALQLHRTWHLSCRTSRRTLADSHLPGSKFSGLNPGDQSLRRMMTKGGHPSSF